MRFCSIATTRTAVHARVLARELARHHPGARLELLLLAPPDLIGPEDPIELIPSGYVTGSAAKMCWFPLESSAHSQLLAHALDSDSDELIVLLDPATDVRAPLDRLEHLLGDASVGLVRRTRRPIPDDGLRPSAEDLAAAGSHWPGLVIARRDDRARTFAAAWRAAAATAVDDTSPGALARARHADTPTIGSALDAVATLEGVVEMGAPLHVSSWNAHELEIADDALAVGDGPIALVALDGFDPREPHWLDSNADRVRLPDVPALATACHDYARRVLEAGWRDTGFDRRIGDQLPDGTVYDTRLATLHTMASEAGIAIGDPLSAEGSERLLAWAAEPAPFGAEAGINRYLLLAYGEREDLAEVYPDLDGPDGVGFVGWAWVYGQHEIGIQPGFLPPRPAGIDADVLAPAATEPRSHAPHSEIAVEVTGFLTGTLGLGEASRLYVRALEAAAVPVRTTTIEPPDSAAVSDTRPTTTYARVRYEDVRAIEIAPTVNLVCVNPDELPHFAERLGSEFWQGRRSIGVWAWETDHVPDRWAAAYQWVDEIWVYTRFVAENLARAADVPVVPIPPAVVAPDPRGATPGIEFPPGFRFLFLFDFNSTVQRKNPLGVISAFSSAFAPGEGPQLIIKTLNAHQQLPRFDELRLAAAGRDDIHVVDASLSVDEKNALVASCDCYVSLHRSEGFGLTLAECMALGKPVIGTAYSGTLDFMTHQNSYLVGYELCEVGPDADPYPPDGRWAEPDLDHAAELMRAVVDDPSEASARGARAKRDIERTLSPEAAGRVARARLERLDELGDLGTERTRRKGVDPAAVPPPAAHRDEDANARRERASLVARLRRAGSR